MTGSIPTWCEGKKIYKTYTGAVHGADHLNKYNAKSRGNPYRCPTCHFFHVGNTLGDLRKVKPYKRQKKGARRGRIQISN